MEERQRYRYVGPDEIRDSPAGTVAMDIITTADLRSWMNAQQHDPDEMVTFIVTVAGTLRVAPRRSEHVACARGNDVLAAGEMTFGRSEFGWSVTEVTNQSTGYCADPDCWPAVAAALNRADIGHPGAFTYQVVFRRCPSCNERNIVHEHDFTCALCEQPLPLHWNFPVV
ncbi:hypothetical protein [Actinoplanes derwentensis]|uniref:Uncharacterized protein n=1 Tax=Actinoplanes derwentensis TaxID=113562 RepID=A0A1H1TLQ7_9ACTN|nr:hypothetical protein [Actinoplanes derwentensis]GID85067.1 hypothetical protein Ade03nite_39910 [Actinoplanes derwentensis]SDS61094.1 hypothetical protein SAMN04489716_1175 [Actinoplanes derwentensis]